MTRHFNVSFDIALLFGFSYFSLFDVLRLET
jgi:hypothetical protein